jgi:uncharacterized membrane protein YkoI
MLRAALVAVHGIDPRAGEVHDCPIRDKGSLQMLERRKLLRHMAAALAAGVLWQSGQLPASAKDGGGGDGHDGGHDDHGGDDHGGDDHGEDGGDDNGGSRLLNQDEVLREREKGRIITLRKALGIVDGSVKGKVIDVKMTKGFKGAMYRITVRRNNGRITTIRLDARTGAVVGPLGF